jgi:ribosomal protein S18 acetylase RimI-like enzyme
VQGLLKSLDDLRASSEVVLWGEGAVKLDGSQLDQQGFRLVARQAFTQELARVPDPEPTDLEVLPLDETRRVEAGQLFARTHAMNVEGLYATYPAVPTLEECEAAFRGYVGGAEGKPVAAASFAIPIKNRVVGVICCAQTDEEGTGVLLGLAVDPSVRGRGLSRVLVRRAQWGLKSAGFARMRFLTTDRNAPVQRLFTPEEIVSTETFPIRLWFRETLASMQPPRPR